MKKRISRIIKRFRRRFPISFRLIFEDREHIHQNPVRKPANVVSNFIGEVTSFDPTAGEMIVEATAGKDMDQWTHGVGG